VTKLFLFDIEGTTTDISFVHKILFPYAKERLKDFILSHQENSSVISALKSVQETVQKEEHVDLGLHECINKLLFWIDSDRKHGALKELQGLIWDEGYSKGHFKGHVYEDVKPFFERIKKNHSQIGIYSSGSVHAQKLIFRFSEVGDLTPFISYYFDTKVGAKREKASYENIIRETRLSPQNITFFSDISEELEAALEAGVNVIHVVREGTHPSTLPMIQDFSKL
jgi:enolase-phosphatase E1